MKVKLCIIILLIAYNDAAFAADPKVTIKAKRAEISRDVQECNGFPEDRLVLQIKIDNKEIEQEFCSAYGISDAKIVKDTRGVNYLLLKRAEGRGTHCTTKYLQVFRIESTLEELVRFPVYEPVGLAANCYYDYKIKKPKDGGLLFFITVRIEDVYQEAHDDELLPKEKERTISIK